MLVSLICKFIGHLWMPLYLKQGEDGKIRIVRLCARCGKASFGYVTEGEEDD